jgi:hypothetical protein
MQHELLEGGPPLGNDEEPDGRASCDEGLLDRPPAGDEFLLLAERLR